GLSVWDRRVSHEALAKEPASASDHAPSPLVTTDRVVVLVPGASVVHGFARDTGAPAFEHRLSLPPPPDGYTLEQLGIEPAGLVEAPAGAAAPVDPARARSRAPLAAVIGNVWARAAGARSWRKAVFH